MARLVDVSPGLARRLEELAEENHWSEEIKTKGELEREINNLFNPAGHTTRQGLGIYQALLENGDITKLWTYLTVKNPNLIDKDYEVIVDQGKPNERVATTKEEFQLAEKQRIKRREEERMKELEGRIRDKNVYIFRQNEEGDLVIGEAQRKSEIWGTKVLERMEKVLFNKRRKERGPLKGGAMSTNLRAQQKLMRELIKEEKSKNLTPKRKAEIIESKNRAQDAINLLSPKARYLQFKHDNPGMDVTFDAFRSRERWILKQKDSRKFQKKLKQKKRDIRSGLLKDIVRDDAIQTIVTSKIKVAKKYNDDYIYLNPQTPERVKKTKPPKYLQRKYVIKTPIQSEWDYSSDYQDSMGYY